MSVFVAVDKTGGPVSVQSFRTVTEEQKRLAKYAAEVKDALDATVDLKPEEVVDGKA